MCLIRLIFAGPRRQREISDPKHQRHDSGSNPRRETGISSVEHSHPIVRYCPQFFVRELNMRSTMSHSRHFARDYNVRPLQCQIPSFPCEIAISGPNNIRSHDFRARLQYQAPTMSDPTLLIGSYNIRPRQCHTPRFSSDQAPTMSDPTVFVESYNIRPRKCQTARFVGSYNIRPRQCQIPRFSYETIRLRLGYGRPNPTRFLRDYNVRPPDYFDAKLQ